MSTTWEPGEGRATLTKSRKSEFLLVVVESSLAVRRAALLMPILIYFFLKRTTEKAKANSKALP